MRAWKEFTKGIIKENPVFVMALGLCPTLAVTTSAFNGVGMGLASTFVLLGSNTVVSLIKKLVPDKVRIPMYIVVIATFVTLVQMFMKAYFPALDKALGLFIPLIVVNCMILGRAEAFASKNNLFYSIIDALGVGVGFTLALTLIGAIREILGSNSIFGYQVVEGFQPMGFFVLAPGAFLTIGVLIAIFKAIEKKNKSN